MEVDLSNDLEVTISGHAAVEEGAPAEFDGLLWRKVPKAWSRATAAQDSSLIGDTITPAAELSVAKLQQEENDVYAQIAAEAAEAERLQTEKLEREQQAAMEMGHRADDNPLVIEREFLDQSHFYYAVPSGTSPERVHLPAKGLNRAARARERPLQTAIPPHIPDDPPGGVDAVMVNPSIAVEQERLYAERLEILKLKTSAIRALREAAEFDGEELMFAVDGDAHSSDDSDGYDEDFQEEWRDQTNEIYSACRAVECNLNDEDAFHRLGRLAEDLQDSDLLPTEQEMMWNALRWVYRKAEPMHPKHWLTSCSSILQDEGFESRPSVGNWCYLLSRMSLLRCFSQRRREKIERWKNRAVFLVRKRLVILRELGIDQPSWRQVHVSVAAEGNDHQRRLQLPVPTMTLSDTLEALTTHSKPMSADGARCGPNPQRRK